MKYYGRDPFGNERGDMQAAQVVWSNFEVRRNPKKKSTPFEVKDFLLKYTEQPKQQTVQQQQSIAKMITIGMGGTVKNG